MAPAALKALESLKTHNDVDRNLKHVIPSKNASRPCAEMTRKTNGDCSKQSPGQHPFDCCTNGPSSDTRLAEYDGNAVTGNMLKAPHDTFGNTRDCPALGTAQPGYQQSDRLNAVDANAQAQEENVNREKMGFERGIAAGSVTAETSTAKKKNEKQS